MAAAMASGQLAAQDRRVELSGVPALSFNSDEGVGYGAVIALYGYDGNPTVYRWTLQPTVFLTTKGRRDFTVFFDAPSRQVRSWRTTIFAGRNEYLATPYYGIGNATDYRPEAEADNPYYYRFGRDQWHVMADVQHQLGVPAVRLLLGTGFAREAINLTPFDRGTTLIAQQLGVAGLTGRTNYVRAGVTFDTRDREIGTHEGTWADVLIQRVDRRLGSTNDYTRAVFTVRRYSPIGDRLTVANRVLAQTVAGNAPFYALADVQTTQTWQDGLGGASTVRGLPKDRYVGKGTFVSNNELRWRAVDFSVIGRPSSLIVSGFVDAGRVWADQLQLGSALQDLHAGYGGGVRLAFGQSFVVATDIGHSSQSAAATYIGLGYLF